MSTQQSEHLRPGPFDDGYPRQQSWSQVKGQDRLCRCGQVRLLRGNNMVEIGDDGAEHPEAPKVELAGYRCWNTWHQEKPSNVGWRCPDSCTTFGFIVEQLFAAKNRNAVLSEKCGIGGKERGVQARQYLGVGFRTEGT